MFLIGAVVFEPQGGIISGPGFVNWEIPGPLGSSLDPLHLGDRTLDLLAWVVESSRFSTLLN